MTKRVRSRKRGCGQMRCVVKIRTLQCCRRARRVRTGSQLKSRNVINKDRVGEGNRYSAIRLTVRAPVVTGGNGMRIGSGTAAVMAITLIAGGSVHSDSLGPGPGQTGLTA